MADSRLEISEEVMGWNTTSRRKWDVSAPHLGEGRQFPTMNQMGKFEAALEKHCEEASAIVEDFSGEWFS